jgi:hypothetical protein
MSSDPKIPFVPMAIPLVFLQLIFDSVKTNAEIMLLAKGIVVRIETRFDAGVANYKSIADGCRMAQKAIYDLKIEIMQILREAEREGN